jgi:MSHA pilin protein MshD
MLYKNERGVTLLELVLIIVVLAIGLTGILGYFTQGVKDSSYAQNVSVASTLTQDLMEEIRSKCWDDTATSVAPCGGAVTPSIIGTDGGESRAGYDDIDDFNGLSNTPPKDSQGVSMAAFGIFTQSAAVCYVAAGDLNTCAGGTSNYKKITVTVSWGSSGDQVQLVSVATNR